MSGETTGSHFPELPSRQPQVEIGYISHGRDDDPIGKNWLEQMNKVEVANPDAIYHDFFNLSESDKEKLTEKIKSDDGLVRIFVHPYFLTTAENLQEEQTRINKVLSKILENENSPAVIILEDYEQIENLYNLIKTANQGDIYIAPTFQSRGEPYPNDNSYVEMPMTKVNRGPDAKEISDIKTPGSFEKNWQVFVNLLRSFGVTKILLGGSLIYTDNMDSGKQTFAGCMGSAFDVLKDNFETHISNASNHTPRELKDLGAHEV